MEKTYENDYYTIEIDKAKSIFLYRWKPTTKELSIEDFMQEGLSILDAILKDSYDYIIGDDINFFVIITPEVQEAMNQQMFLKLNTKIKKFIHISSEDILRQVMVEQAFEENTDATYTDHFVYSLEEALKIIDESI